MKKAIIPTLAILATFGILVGLAAFTDINSPQYYGKTGIPKAYSAIDANFAAIESGTQAGAFTTLTINDAMTAVSTNDATTNVLVTVGAEVDGEYIADDTVDDDSIDFADVTGADMTLTDCGVVTGSSVSATGDMLAGDDLTVTDDATVGGMFRITPTALTVTNAQPITITDSSYILNVSGSANNYTNTPVIANPTTAGDIVILHVLAASSNLLAIADSGNMLLSAAWEGGDNDVLVLQAITTSLWAEISRSAN